MCCGPWQNQSTLLRTPRLGEGDSPIFLTGHRKIGTVPAGFQQSQFISYQRPISMAAIIPCRKIYTIKIVKNRSIECLPGRFVVSSGGEGEVLPGEPRNARFCAVMGSIPVALRIERLVPRLRMK